MSDKFIEFEYSLPNGASFGTCDDPELGGSAGGEEELNDGGFSVFFDPQHPRAISVKPWTNTPSFSVGDDGFESVCIQFPMNRKELRGLIMFLQKAESFMEKQQTELLSSDELEYQTR